MISQTIGYQGAEFSNSMEAANLMANKLSLSDSKFLPLISSQGVVNALLEGSIQLGVLAIENTLAGPVIETKIALANISYEILCTEKLHIHHCLFKLNGIDEKEITAVASHIQALSQCKDSINKLLPNTERIELEDTAIGARYLKNGKLAAQTAVLCRQDAGENYQLEMIAKNIEDSKCNITTFYLVKLSK